MDNFNKNKYERDEDIKEIEFRVEEILDNQGYVVPGFGFLLLFTGFVFLQILIFIKTYFPEIGLISFSIMFIVSLFLNTFFDLLFIFLIRRIGLKSALTPFFKKELNGKPVLTFFDLFFLNKKISQKDIDNIKTIFKINPVLSYILKKSPENLNVLQVIVFAKLVQKKIKKDKKNKSRIIIGD